MHVINPYCFSNNHDYCVILLWPLIIFRTSTYFSKYFTFNFRFQGTSSSAGTSPTASHSVKSTACPSSTTCSTSGTSSSPTTWVQPSTRGRCRSCCRRRRGISSFWSFPTASCPSPSTSSGISSTSCSRISWIGETPSTSLCQSASCPNGGWKC